MKKFIPALLLAGSLILTGCGDTKNDYSQVSGQQGNPGPIVTPTPTPTAGYFVDAVNGDDTTAAVNPTSDTPFKTIQAAVADAPEGATITVRPGNYTGAVNLKDDQRLLGVASGTRPVLDNTITLADGNTVDFLRIQGATDFGINGNDQNGGTITNCEIVGIVRSGPSTGTGIHVKPGVGSWTIEGNTILNSQGVGIIADAAGTSSTTYRINNNTITDSAFNGIGFVAEGTSQVLAQVTGNILTGNGVNATVEVIVADTANFGLDLEDNQNDDVYGFFRENTGAVFQVEQLSTLTTPKPAGAGNTGTVDISSGPTSSPVTEVPNGTFSF